MKINSRLISIGIPVFNGEKYLSDCIKSALNQDYKNFEIIISDNCSNDSTATLIKNYQNLDSRIKVKFQKKNIGAFNNFKEVLDLSTGDLFIWLAADDKFGSQNFLSILQSDIENGYDYAFPNVDIIGESSEVMASNIMAPFAGAKKSFERFEASLKINSHQVYSLFKKSILLDEFYNLEKYKKLRNYNEGVFVHSLSLNKNGFFDPRVTKIYRVHKNNISLNVSKCNSIISFANYCLGTLKIIILSQELTLIQRFYLFLNAALRQIKHLILILTR